MKQILTILMTLISMFAATAQTRSLATLLHDGKLTFFDKVTSLESAIAAAVDGDTIYLSDGKFGASSLRISFNTNITFIGSGYNSDIVSELIYNPDIQSKSVSGPNFEGIKLKTLYFNPKTQSYASYGINDFTMTHCNVDSLNFNSAYTYRTIIERCKVRRIINVKYADYHFINSKIKEYGGQGNGILENCHVIHSYSPSRYNINSIIENAQFANNGEYHAKHENCLIGITTGDYKYHHTFISCWETDSDILNDDTLECNVDLSDYTGTDGTSIGIYGGQGLPFSETPTVPTVDSANSSVEYDKEGNKLNVTITVAPN